MGSEKPVSVFPAALNSSDPKTPTLAVQELTCPTHNNLPCTFTPFITASVRQGVKQSLHTWAQIVPCILQPWSPLKRRKSQCTHKHQHTRPYVLYARRSDVVVNDFRGYIGYGDARKHVRACRLRLTIAIA